MNPAHKTLILKALENEEIKIKKLHLKLLGVNRYAVTVNGEFYGIFDAGKDKFVSMEG